jgi:uncharacterized repeat protein (TIGR03803 family)
MRILGLSVTLALSMQGVAPGAAPLLTTLYRFSGQAGAYPEARVVFGADGALYGTTIQGGAASRGTAFQLKPPAAKNKPWTATMLYSFGTQSGSPGTPNGGLVFDSTGAVYGVTVNGGSAGWGAVYQLTPPQPGGQWMETTIHNFAGQPDGQAPAGDLVFGLNGALYGVTAAGGAGGQGCVFALTPPGSPGGAWTESIVYSFGGAGDGVAPQAGLLSTASGTLYGTTYAGGTSNLGTVFSLTPPSAPGDNWTEAVLYSFQGGSDGANPWAALAMDRHGALYGTTYMGGTPHEGTVFELAPPTAPGGAWTESVLYSFQGGNDGASPQSNVVFGNKGSVLYGTTGGGGIDLLGTVFKLMPPVPGGGWTETVLYQFQFSDGSLPVAGLAVNANGALFGTTENGGTPERGTVFRLVP